MAWAAPFSFGGNTIFIVRVADADHFPVAVPINMEPGFDLNKVKVTSDTEWLKGEVDAAKKQLVLSFTYRTFGGSFTKATVTLSDGESSAKLSVDTLVNSANASKLIVDSKRPRAYVIFGGPISGKIQESNRGCIVAYDTETEKPLGSWTISSTPTDASLNPTGDELAVLCAGRPYSDEAQIEIINLATLKRGASIPLPKRDPWSKIYTDTSARRLSYGIAGELLATDGNSEPELYRVERSTGTSNRLNNPEQTRMGWGAIAASPDQRYLVAIIENYAAQSEEITLFSLSPTEAPRRISFYSESVKLHYPETTPVLFSADGSCFAAGRIVLSTSDFSQPLAIAPDTIYSFSRTGDLYGTRSGVFETRTGKEVYGLGPIDDSVQGFTPDNRKWILFNSYQRALITIDLNGRSSLAPTRTPSDGAIVPQSQTVSWAAVPSASSYDVYIALDQAEVSSGVPNSSAYQGRVTGTSWTPANLAAGKNYYLRIDPVFDSSPYKGLVSTFRTSAAAPSQPRVQLAAIDKLAGSAQTLTLGATTPGAAWTATSANSWLKLSAAAGTTPSDLEMRLDLNEISTGSYNTTVKISTGADSYDIPIEVAVAPLNLISLQSLEGTDRVYGVTAPVKPIRTSKVPSILFEVDTTKRIITRLRSLQGYTSSFACSSQDNYIYATNYEDGELLKINRDSFLTDTILRFTPYFGRSEYGYNCYSVTAGRAGRLTVSENLSSTINLHDAVSGRLLGQTTKGGKGTFFSKDKRFLYSSANNAFSGTLYKIDTLSDGLTEAASVTRDTSSKNYATPLTISDDGAHLAWQGAWYSDNLELGWKFGDDALALSSDGRYIYSPTKVYDTTTKSVVAPMLGAPNVGAFNAASGVLVIPLGEKLGFVRHSSSLNGEALLLSQNRTTPAALNVDWAVNYFSETLVLQYRKKGDSAWTERRFDLKTSPTGTTVNDLIPGGEYEVRAQVMNGNVTSAWTTMTMRSGTYSPPSIQRHPESASISGGYSFDLQVFTSSDLPATYQWYHDGEAIPGANLWYYRSPPTTAKSAGNYTVVVTNAVGSVTSAPAVISVKINDFSVPYFATYAESVVLRPGWQGWYFQTTVPEGKGWSVFWYKNGVQQTTENFWYYYVKAEDYKEGDYYQAEIVAQTKSVMGPPLVIRVATAATKPEFFTHPQSVTQRPGTTITLAASASGENLTYRWKRDGVTVSESAFPNLVLKQVTPQQSGTYVVEASNDLGVAASRPAVVSVAEPSEGRLANISLLAPVPPSGNIVLGFVVTDASRELLVRAAGPSLFPFGVDQAAQDPVLTVIQNGTNLGSNDDWSIGDNIAQLKTTIAKYTGFPFVEGSKDAAYLVNGQGAMTVSVARKAGSAGSLVLAEAYALEGQGRIVNMSSLTDAGSGSKALTLGFVLQGNEPLPFLIRGLGPTLTGLGVSNALTDPQIALYRTEGGISTQIASNDNWATEVGAKGESAIRTGLPLKEENAKDAAIWITLAPGAYTVVLTPADGKEGKALIELYLAK